MQFPAMVVRRLIQFLVILLSTGVVLSASISDISAEIFRTCSSPFKDILIKQNNSVTEFCGFRGSCMQELDGRLILCCGLLDLLNSSCSSRPFDSAKNSKIDEPTKRVDDFCIEWKSQVRTDDRSLYLKSVTQTCESACKLFDGPQDKLHPLCSLLLTGYLLRFEISEAPANSSLIIELPPVSSEPKPPSFPSGENLNLKSNASEVSSPKPQMDQDNHLKGEQLFPADKKMDEEGVKNPPVEETQSNVNEASKPMEDLSSKITNSENEAGDVAPNSDKLSKTGGSDIKTKSKPLDDLAVTNSNKETDYDIKDDIGNDLVQDGNGPNVNGPETIQENPSSSENIQQGNLPHQNSNPSLYPPDDDVGLQNAQEIQYNGKLYDAQDSPFFGYFMIISAAFILGYVAIVNKKKLIALIVEGRRDGSRRRHHSASYSKLDSNLEEALSSNRTTVSSHQVLY